jgi:hypothetical protein
VRLGGARAGKWCDAATAEHGDLLDLIAQVRGALSLKDAIAEARQFLALPAPAPPPRREEDSYERTRAAQRLFAMAQPIAGTLVETYLRHRGIALLDGPTPLRFHASCLYHDTATSARERRPALLAAITDPAGRITGVHRTWLDSSGRGKAPVATPRRALGRLHGHGVRLGRPGEILVAGEGLETVLSLKTILPRLPMVAALSASHLGALVLPPGLRRLYVARDRDPAGQGAFERLARRAQATLSVRPLDPVGGDFNDDLVAMGATGVRRTLRQQMDWQDVAIGSE